MLGLALTGKELSVILILMPEKTLMGELREFCITDVGSTTTKAILFKKSPDWRFFREEAVTTVEKPHEDVTVGVVRALQALEKITGETLLENGVPAVPYFSTSSAGGGLAMVVTGLIKDITAESADRVALGAGAVVLDVVAMNDGRTPYRKIEDLKRLRPDMVLLAGGFDGDAVSGPVFLAELITESGLHPKLNPNAKLAVIYAGNINAQEHVRETLSDRFMFYPIPNIRPAGEQENLEPARDAIHHLFMDHVMSQAPGYERLKRWVDARILPTPAGFGRILSLISKDMKARILAIDIGGATTDVFTAENGNVFRTVSANLGMSYSILNVAGLNGVGPIKQFLDFPITETELWNRIGNKHINPTSLPENNKDMMIEWAVATIAIREAVSEHLKVMQGKSLSSGPAELNINNFMRVRQKKPTKGKPFTLEDYDMIIGSGGILSHSPRGAAAMMLVNALQPKDAVQLAVDRAFMFPHLGVLAEVNPELAKELFGKLGIVRLKPGKKVDEKSYVPPARKIELNPEERIYRGAIHMRRELAIPGRIFVKSGDMVKPDTLVAKSVRQFLRPFFIHVAEALEVKPEELPNYLVKKVGDEIGLGDIVAKKHRLMFPKLFLSPVEGRIERVLPSGTLVVREKPEAAREFTTVNVAKELGVESREIKPYLKCEIGQEVSKGQWLAAIMRPGNMKVCKSPVRGKVNRINLNYGMVIIEPLLEELEVLAWLPGKVRKISDKGGIVSNQGIIITGAWGQGKEAFGKLKFDKVEAGQISVTDWADRNLLVQLQKRGAAGLITAGLDLENVLEPNPGFTIVVTGGFGQRKMDPDILEILKIREGKLALIDGTTQLRVGVKRPRIILPDLSR